MTLTPLEIDVLRAFQVEFGAVGFPSPESFTVTDRENTGAGRFTGLAADAVVVHPNPCALSWMIQMAGLQNGLGALVFLVDGKPQTLELHLWGDDGWDGIERPWQIGPAKVQTNA